MCKYKPCFYGNDAHAPTVVPRPFLRGRGKTPQLAHARRSHKNMHVCTRGVGQASRAHIFAESAAQNPYIFRIAGLRVYRPAGTAGVNLNKVRR